ncbi:MAG: hypothetical protein IJI60_03120 [Bacilli bacterium]|nr:hypothetical protein [Bacilli bacterium]
MKRGKNNQGKKRREERKLERYGSEAIVDGKWIVFLSVVIVFLAFYLLTVYITNSRTTKKKNTETEEEKVSSSEILLGRSFAMSDGEYLVLYYDSSKEEASTCEELFTNYEASHGENSIYFVDMNRGFNKAHQTEGESNKNPSSAEELSINGPTLIKVQEKKSVDYIEGIDSITNYLNA